MISKLINKTDNEAIIYWYKIISNIEFAINNSKHKMTSETLSKLLFGVDQRGVLVNTITEYLAIKRMWSKLECLRERAAERIQRNQKYSKEYFDKKRNTARTYNVDNFVMINNIDTLNKVFHKIIPKFKGPYEVMRALRNDRYVIKNVSDFQANQKFYEGTWEAANMRPWSVGCSEVGVKNIGSSKVGAKIIRSSKVRVRIGWM